MRHELQATIRLIDGQLVAETCHGPHRRTFGVDSLNALRSALLHDPFAEWSDQDLLLEARRDAAIKARFAPRQPGPSRLRPIRRPKTPSRPRPLNGLSLGL